MRVKVKFLSPMMKNGKVMEIGEELEMDATAAVLLAKKGNVEIPGYDIKPVKQEITVDELVKIN